MRALGKKRHSAFFRFCLISSLIILFPFCIYGQNYQYFRNTSNTDFLSPLALIISQDNYFDSINDSIASFQNKSRTSFLLINASEESSNDVIDTVNQILNKEYQIDKTRIYLIVIGDKIFFESQSQFSNNSLFSSKYFIQTDNQTVGPSSFETVHYSDMNLKKIILKQNESRLWQYDLDKLKNLSLENDTIYKKSWEIGFGFSQHYPLPIRTDDEFPDNISAYEIQVSYNLTPKYKIWGTLAVSNLMLSKKGDPGGQLPVLSKDKQLAESTMFARSLSITRFFYSSEKPVFKPYVALGISHTHLMLMYMDGREAEMTLYSCGSLMITSGLEINLPKNFIFNSKMSYHVSLNNYNTMNNFNFTFGLSYLLQRKKKPFYEYVR